MPTYTLTTDLIEKIASDEMYLYDSILGVFTNMSSPNKLAVDKDLNIFKIYAEAQPKGKFKEQYKCWLERLSNCYVNVFEKTYADISTIINNPMESFKCIAASVNGSKKIIVHSRSSCDYTCDGNDETDYKGTKIKVLDKDETVNELNRATTNIISDSNIENSTINQGNN